MKAISRGMPKPSKRRVTMRVDAEVLEWLKQSAAEDYQARLNALLKDAMLRAKGLKQER